MATTPDRETPCPPALQLRPGEGELVGDLLLSALVHVAALSQPGEELVLVLAQLLAQLLPHAPTTPTLRL